MSEEKKRGIILATFAMIGNSAKGALGREFFSAGVTLKDSIKDRVLVQSCPRCHEHSLIKNQGKLCCTREDICGWAGTEHDLASYRQMPCSISPLVYSLAKGRPVDQQRQARNATIFSWFFWVLCALLFFYAIYGFIAIGPLVGIWVLLVCMMVALNGGIKMAYRAQYLKGGCRCSPKEFLLLPRLWFVVR